MNNIKRARKRIDIFIKRLFVLSNKCDVLQEHLVSVYSPEGLNSKMLADIIRFLKKSAYIVGKYKELDKNLAELHKRIENLETRLSATPAYFYAPTYGTVDNIREYLFDVVTRASSCAYDICHMFPVVGHKYLIQDGEITSFIAPIDKARVFGREE